jgi:hypothetical protein
MIPGLSTQANQFYQQNPNNFCEDFFKFESGEAFIPYDYQANLMRALVEHRFVAGMFSRQTGKTEIDSAIADIEALLHDGHNIPITAPRQRHSNRIIARCKRTLKNSRYWDTVLYKMTSEEHPDLAWSRTTIELSNGSTITALPEGDEGTAYLGESANLAICDEVARFKDAEGFIASVVKPSVFATGGKILLTSSSWGRVGKGVGWYNLLNSNEFYKIEVNAYEALSQQKPHLSEREYKDRMDFLRKEEVVSPITFKMQYLNSFEGGLDVPFNPDKVVSMFVKTPYQSPNLLSHRRIMFAIDWGKSLRTGDKTVLGIADVTNPLDLHVHDILSWQEPYTKVTEKILNLAKIWHPKYVRCDIGSGEHQLEVLTKEFRQTSAKVEGVYASTTAFGDSVRIEHGVIRKVISKNLAIEALGYYIDNDLITIHKDIPETKKQLLDYVKEVTDAGNIKYGHLPGGHDDDVDVLMFIVDAVRNKSKIQGTRISEQVKDALFDTAPWGKRDKVFSPI